MTTIDLTKVGQAMVDALCDHPGMDEHIDSCDAVVSTVNTPTGPVVSFGMSKLVDGGPSTHRPGRFVRYRVTLTEVHQSDDED